MATKRQIASDWLSEGGPPDAAGLMAEIAWSESSGNDRAVSRTGCKGRFQLCPPPPDAMDPLANTRHAIRKWDGGRGHGHWTKWNPKAKRLHATWIKNPHAFDRNLPKGGGGSSVVDKAADALKFGLDNLPGPAGVIGDLLPGGDSPIPNPFAGIELIAEAIAALVNTFRDLFDWLTSSETWVNFGKIVAGFFLAAMGIRGAWHIATR